MRFRNCLTLFSKYGLSMKELCNTSKCANYLSLSLVDTFCAPTPLTHYARPWPQGPLSLSKMRIMIKTTYKLNHSSGKDG